MRRRVRRGVNSCGQSVVWWGSISSQLLGPRELIFSGYVGGIYGSAQLQYEWDMLRNKKLLLVGPFCDILKKLDFHPFFALVKSTSRKWLVRSQ